MLFDSVAPAASPSLLIASQYSRETSGRSAGLLFIPAPRAKRQARVPFLPSVRLTPPQRLSLGRLLKEKAGDFPPCAICRSAAGYSIGGSLVRAPAMEGDESVGPLVAMSCTKCGHTLFFHARILGLE